MNQRLLKVPTWRARIEWQMKVQTTLRVQMRDNGNFRLPMSFWVDDVERWDSSSWDPGRDSSSSSLAFTLV